MPFLYILCWGNIIYTQAPPHIVHGALLAFICPCLRLRILSASSGVIAREICLSQFNVRLASVLSLSHLIAFSLIFTRSPAWAAILYAIKPSFTSSELGS